MRKNWLILFYVLFSASAFSQLTDTSKIRKLYLQAYGIEKPYPDSAIKLYEDLISQTKANPNQKTIGMSYHRLAEILYNQKKDLNKYFSLCFTAVKIFETINDSIGATQIYQNLGVNLVRQNRFEEALAYHEKVVNYSARHHLSNLLIAGTMSIAECYSSLNKNDTAILILKNLVSNFPKDGKKNDFGMLLNNLGNTYYNLADITGNKKYFSNSIEYATKALAVLNKLPEEYENLAYSYGLLGAGNMAIENYAEAEKQYESAIAIYKKKHLANDLNLMYFELTELNIKQGKTNKALNYFELYDSVSKQLFNVDNSNSISLMKTQFETEKKETENKLLQKENDQQKIINYFIVGGLILVLFFTFFIFRGLKAQRRANKIISKQKEEVHHQKEIVDEKNKEITDSIHYAQRIQRALLTSDTYIKKYVPDYFILYKPKDIVSGDFYWAFAANNKFLITAADCTGHGVPGAFMSLLNISILNEITIEEKIARPDLILNKARTNIIKALNPEGTEIESKDGMDCILCSFDFENLTLEYAAANNSFYIIRNGELLICKADKMPVGKSPTDDQPFTYNQVQLQKNDSVYIFTDGYADQFGGAKGKKFKYKQLEDILVANCNLPVAEQKDILNIKFEEWRGNLEQVDDVLIIGIKI